MLLVLTPVLTELLTNNISAARFFNLQLFLVLAILVYGPVLLLRELAVKWQLGFGGYILLGMAYGIYNEGLFAKTIFLSHLPNPNFDQYGIVWDINSTWLAVIIVFHAFYAFLFPLLIVYNIFPAAANKPWINKKWLLIYSLGFFFFIAYHFLHKMQKPVAAWHFPLLIAGMAFFILIAKNFTCRIFFSKHNTGFWALLLYGPALVLAVFVVSNLIALTKVNAAFFAMYMLCIVIVFILLLHKKYNFKTLLVFCLSAQLSFEAVTMLVAKISGSVTGVITGIILAALFAVALIAVIKKQIRQIPEKQ